MPNVFGLDDSGVGTAAAATPAPVAPAAHPVGNVFGYQEPQASGANVFGYKEPPAPPPPPPLVPMRQAEPVAAAPAPAAPNAQAVAGADTRGVGQRIEDAVKGGFGFGSQGGSPLANLITPGRSGITGALHELYNRAPAPTPAPTSYEQVRQDHATNPNATYGDTGRKIATMLSADLAGNATFKALPPEQQQQVFRLRLEQELPPEFTHAPAGAKLAGQYTGLLPNPDGTPQNFGIDFTKGSAASGLSSGATALGSTLEQVVTPATAAVGKLTGGNAAGVFSDIRGGDVNPLAGKANTAGTAIGSAAPVIGASLINPVAGSTVGASQQVGSAIQEGQQQHYSGWQTAALATERGIVGAVLGFLPGESAPAGTSALKAAAQTTLKVGAINIGQAALDAEVKRAAGVPGDDTWTAIKKAATSGEGWAQAIIFGAAHGVAVKYGASNASPAPVPETRAGQGNGAGGEQPNVGTSEAIRAEENTKDVQTSQVPAAQASTPPWMIPNKDYQYPQAATLPPRETSVLADEKPKSVATVLPAGSKSVSELAAEQRDRNAFETLMHNQREQRIATYTADTLSRMKPDQLRRAAEDMGVTYDTPSATIPRIADAADTHGLDNLNSNELYQRAKGILADNGIAGVKAGPRDRNIAIIKAHKAGELDSNWTPPTIPQQETIRGNQETQIAQSPLQEARQADQQNAGGQGNTNTAAAPAFLDNPRLPSYVNEAMKAAGKDPNRLLNEIDAARPQTREQLANDPVTRFLERTNPAEAARMKRGELSAADYIKHMQEMNNGSQNQSPNPETARPGQTRKAQTKGGAEAAAVAAAPQDAAVPLKPSPPPTDAIGQRGLSKGPPGAIQTNEIPVRSAPEPKTGLAGVLDRAVRAVKGAVATRGRYTPIAARQGEDIAQALTRSASEGSAVANDALRTFKRDAFGGDQEAFAKWYQTGQAIRGINAQEKALSKNPNLTPEEVDALWSGPKMTRGEIGKAMEDPKMAAAAKIWNEQYAPALADIREKNNMLMNPDATHREKFPYFINMASEFDGPSGTDTSVNSKRAFNEKFSGQGNYANDPDEGFKAMIRGHYNTDATQSLTNLIRDKYSFQGPDDTLQPGNKGMVNGRVQDLEKIDVGSPDAKLQGEAARWRDYRDGLADKISDMDNGPEKDATKTQWEDAKAQAKTAAAAAENAASDERWVPKDVASEWNNLKRQQEPRDTLWDRVSGVASRWATTGTFLPHMARVTALAASRLARTGEVSKPSDFLRFMPSWFGSNELALAQAHSMSKSPWGDTMQYLLNGWGANRGSGFGAEGETHAGIFNAGHRALFNPENGADILARRVVAETYLRQALGNTVVDNLKKQADGGGGALPLSRKLSGMLGPKQAIDAGQYVNGTLGFSNYKTRSGLLNAMQRTGLPFIGSESGMIPADMARMATLNLNPKMLSNMVKSGRVGQAAVAAAMVLAQGAVGYYAAKNGVNWLSTKAQTGTGKFMWDNDEGHKDDISLGGGVYLGNLDPSLGRGERLTGVTGALNGGGVKSLPANAAMQNINEGFATTNIKGAFEVLSAIAGSPSTLNVHKDQEGNLAFRKTGIGDDVPLVSNTIRAAMDGKSLTLGVAKDLAKDTTGATVSQVTDEDRHKQQWEDLSRRITDAEHQKDWAAGQALRQERNALGKPPKKPAAARR